MAIRTLGGPAASVKFTDSERNYVRNSKEILVLFTRSATGELKGEEVITDLQVLVPQSTRFLPLWNTDKVAVRDIIPSLQAYCKKEGLELNPTVKVLVHYS